MLGADEQEVGALAGGREERAEGDERAKKALSGDVISNLDALLTSFATR